MRARAAAFYEKALHPSIPVAMPGQTGLPRLQDIPTPSARHYRRTRSATVLAAAIACLCRCGSWPDRSDLGCGAGIDLLIAAQRVGATGKAIGVDVSGVMLERARVNVARAGAANVDLIRAMEALPVDSGAVIRVVSNCVINLSPTRRRCFAKSSVC